MKKHLLASHKIYAILLLKRWMKATTIRSIGIYHHYEPRHSCNPQYVFIVLTTCGLQLASSF